MLLPDEIVARSALPALRAIVGRKLIELHGMTQEEAAERLGITQSAISNYTRRKRGIALDLSKSVEVQKITDDIVSVLTGDNVNRYEVMNAFTRACDYLKKKRVLCDVHEKLDPSLVAENCHACDWGPA